MKISIVRMLTAFGCGMVFLSFFPQDLAAKRARDLVKCDRGETIQAALDRARPGDEIEVSGHCVENIVIEENRITLKGLSGATISAADPELSTIGVLGLNTRIENFASISGGSNGIVVHRGASAVIRGNTVENAASNGINVNNSAFARIDGNTVRNNGGQGINIRQSAAADIFSNTVTGNTQRGIQVGEAASADIADNTITANLSDGIRVRRTAHIRLSDDPQFNQPNLIEGNSGRGIFCRTNSSINFGAAQDFGTGNAQGNTLFEATCVTEGP
jgi:parallel beta-helix repeat protein